MRVVQDVSGICPCLIISFLSALTTKRRWRSKTELLLFVSLCEDAWQTPFRQWFLGREDTCQASLSNITILEQSVYVTSHQTENDVSSNGISSLCLVNRELARDVIYSQGSKLSLSLYDHILFLPSNIASRSRRVLYNLCFRMTNMIASCGIPG